MTANAFYCQRTYTEFIKFICIRLAATTIAVTITIAKQTNKPGTVEQQIQGRRQIIKTNLQEMYTYTNTSVRECWQ